MKEVRLKKTDTCLTYVLRRLGLDPNLCTYQTYHEHFDVYKFTRSKNKLKKGDIFLWDKDKEFDWLPWSIDKGGKILWKQIPIKFHFAIYEGDGVFSDCTRWVRPPHPTIRIRELRDIHKNPDWVLTLNKQHNS